MASLTSEAAVRHGQYTRLFVWLEGGALLAAAPFLLFPTLAPAATVAVMVALAFVWLLALFSNSRALLPLTPFNVTLLAFGLMVIVGIVVTADPAESLPKATGVLLGLAAWRYLVVAATTRRRVQVAAGVLLAIALGFTVVGLFGLQEIPKIAVLGQFNPSRFVDLGAAWLDIAIHPNQLAGLICLYLPLLVSLALAPRSTAARWSRLLIAALAVLVLVALVLTQSRGGWIGALAGLFVLLVLWAAVLPPSPLRRGLRALAVLGVLAGLALLLWIGPQRIQSLWLDPPETTVVGTLSTLNYRKDLWPWAVTAVGDFPLTGLGLGAFREAVFRLYPIPLRPEQDIGHAHNIFLQTALDVGLPGLAVYAAILILAAVVGWRVARGDEGWRPYALGLLAGLAALHVYGLADALALGSKPAVVFWLALGLLAAMNADVRRAAPS